MTEILPGDVLIYTGNSLIDWAIKLKTWSRACHCEIYIGGDKSVAARWPRISLYPLRKEGLAYVLRPVGKLDMGTGMEWFYSRANGLPYAYWELLNFYLPYGSINVRGMICSSFAARFLKHCGFMPFAPEWPKDKVAPANFLMLPPQVFDWVWRA
jgi:hypothetical protein